MSIENQSATVDFSVSTSSTGNADDEFLKVEKACEAILPEKLKEIQLLVWHLKKMKDKIEKDGFNALAKVNNDAS